MVTIGRRSRMSKPASTRPALFVLVAAFGVSACSTGGATPVSPGATPAASVVPSSSPTPVVTPTPGIPDGGLAHPTGATEIVLRFDEAGGFVPPEFLAARLPYFTLYGDGTVVFVQTTAPFVDRSDNVSVGQPVRTARLSEAQVQALLLSALRDGGLALARDSYLDMTVSDAPTAVFEVNADNDSKTVSVYALGMEGKPGPDTAILKAMAGLGARLRDFDQGGTLASAPYEPAAYRGVLMEQQGVQGVRIRDWPWPELAPADFTLPADANALQQGTRTLTPDEVAALGVDGYEGGIASGVWLRGPDGKIYSLAVRPLLPDDKA